MVNEKIAGFDSSLIKRMLKNNFRYNGKIDDLRIEDEDMVVRLYNDDGLDVSIIRKDYFRLKFVIVQSYTGQGKSVIELIDRSKELSVVGWRAENG